MPVQVNAQSVEIDGTRLVVEQQGTGTPILCIHGAGSSALLWRGATERLSALGRVIAYDRRGYGRSREPAAQQARSVSVRRHADDAAALIDALDAAPAVVIARSYGGEVATDLALRYPQHVRALALLEAAPVHLLPAAAEWTRGLRDRLLEVAEREGTEALGPALIALALGPGTWDTLPAPVREVFVDNGPAALADLCGAWLRLDAAALGRIHQPVLLVAASDSRPEFRDPNEVMAQALPNARSVLVTGGHLIDPAAPEVLAFVREVRDDPRG